jgi:hypothetical protein
MKIGIYTTAFNIIKNNFDYQEAFSNWLVYADYISIAVNTSEDQTAQEIWKLICDINGAFSNKPKINLVLTNFSYDDPLCYGKIENAALQGLAEFKDVDLYIQQNLDERIRFDKNKAENLYQLLKDSGAKAFFIPTIDLYGNKESYVNINRKWYWHLSGCFRGPVKFGLKQDGHPDYNKTSTDELIDEKGNLVPTISLIDDLSIDNLRQYVYNGYPISYHLGFLNLTDRAERAKWWKEFWEKATNGDKNNHITDVNELLKRETKKHNLPLWETI